MDTDANKTDTDIEDNIDSSQKDLVCDIFKNEKLGEKKTKRFDRFIEKIRDENIY